MRERDLQDVRHRLVGHEEATAAVVAVDVDDLEGFANPAQRPDHREKMLIVVD